MADRTGAERIAAERQRQIDKEGWTPDHDDEHDNASLAMAAVCYAAQAADERVFVRHEFAAQVSFVDPWPWEGEADARHYGTHEDGTLGNVLREAPDDAFRIRLLEKAGALIAAEIDRLIRAKKDGDA